MHNIKIVEPEGDQPDQGSGIKGGGRNGSLNVAQALSALPLLVLVLDAKHSNVQDLIYVV